MSHKLSNQGIGAIMMALQKGIMEEMDITQLLKDFVLLESVDGLIVDNPPVLNIPESNLVDTSQDNG
tara:strand:+ start:211 stop:411 length:201 start_codon:yes stop_codon:yes gene_type:complete